MNSKILVAVMALSGHLAVATPSQAAESTCVVGVEVDTCIVTAASEQALLVGYVGLSPYTGPDAVVGLTFSGPGVYEHWGELSAVADVVAVQPGEDYVLAFEWVTGSVVVATDGISTDPCLVDPVTAGAFVPVPAWCGDPDWDPGDPPSVGEENHCEDVPGCDPIAESGDVIGAPAAWECHKSTAPAFIRFDDRDGTTIYGLAGFRCTGTFSRIRTRVDIQKNGATQRYVQYSSVASSSGNAYWDNHADPVSWHCDEPNLATYKIRLQTEVQDEHGNWRPPKYKFSYKSRGRCED